MSDLSKLIRVIESQFSGYFNPFNEIWGGLKDKIFLLKYILSKKGLFEPVRFTKNWFEAGKKFIFVFLLGFI